MSASALALIRAPLRPLEVEARWDVELLEQAAKLLDYRPVAVAEVEKAQTRGVNETIFARILADLDIQPFTVKSVQLYKAQMIRKLQKQASSSFVQYMHRSGHHDMEKGQTVVHAVGWPTWIGTGILLAVCLIGHFSGVNAGWGWDGHKSIEIVRYMSLNTVQHLMTLPVIAVGTWLGLMWARHKKASKMECAWSLQGIGSDVLGPNGYRLDAYIEALPAFVLQRMVSLKEVSSEMTFSIESLRSNKTDLNTEKRVALPPDPFVIATFRGVSAYIDVFDEPGFEGRRTI